MADISEKELKKEIAKILKNDKKLAPKKVRQKLEDILDTNLSDKKKLIEKLVTEYSNNDADDDEEKGDEDDEDESDSKKKSGKRSASASKSSSKKAQKASSEDEADDGSNGSEPEDDKKKKKTSDGESGDEVKKESTSEDKSQDLTKEEDEFRVEIAKILKNANLAKTSSKKVRQTLEKKLGVDLTEKRKLIDRLVMEYVINKDDNDDDEEEEEEEVPAKKKKKESDDNDSDWGKGKAKKAPKAKKGGARGKGGGYTRAYRLSPALAELVGAAEMARHEVVRRVWDIIKTKQLYDPNNRQFAICDHALYKVFGTTRFRTFGMMKYLKSHFLDD